jgi:hypothetical protein
MSIFISSSSLDVPTYVRPPRLGVASGLSLSKLLLLKVPKKPGPGVIMAAKALAAAVVSTETAWRTQGRGKPPRNARSADVRVDRAHSTVHGRLAHYEILGADHSERVRSGELLVRLYPSGLDFIKLPWIEEHAESERRVQIIEEEELREDLERLVGEAFVEELFEAHAAYGVALGITEPSEEPAPVVSMIEPLRVLVQAISDYALQVLAFGKLDAKNVAAAQRALAPIDAFRLAASRRGSGGAAVDEEDYELPEGAPAPDSPVPVVAEE